MPSYARFLKDLCTVKRNLKITDKAFGISEHDEVIRINLPPKFKDPGSPTIYVNFGENRRELALLDLGASCNIMSYNLYQELQLGKLTPCRNKLQLADNSFVNPLGIIEDVVIQINIFYFLADFMILEMTGNTNNVPIILGRPWLATANSLINCRDGTMHMTFGDMIIKTNIYEAMKKPNEDPNHDY